MKTLLLSLVLILLSFPTRALTLSDEYQAVGTDAVGKQHSWAMQTRLVSPSEAQLINMLPSQMGQEVVLTCQIEQQSLVIHPQIISTNEDLGWYLFAFSPDSPDGSLTLQVDDRGQILGHYSITYGVFTTPEFDATLGKTYLGYHTALTDISYTTEVEDYVAPVASCFIEGLPLYAGMSASGSTMAENHILVPAYQPLNLINTTAGEATAWQWTATAADGTALCYDDEELMLEVPGRATYSDLSLTAFNHDAASEPYTVGAALGCYKHSVIHAGGTSSDFLTTDGTPAILTAFNPDTRLTFYNNWGTPDVARTPMSSIVSYHPSPSAPLYIEGLCLPLARAQFQSDFRLHISIARCTYTGDKPDVGEVLAEADATLADVDQSQCATGGLALIRFTNLYHTASDGSRTDLHHLFLDSEFLITLSDWDNGTFTGIIGASHISSSEASQRVSTWFEPTLQPGTLLTYQTWPTRLYIGFLGAAYGYLVNVNDNDNVNNHSPLPISFPEAGGEQILRIHPMLTAQREDGSPRTLLYFENRAAMPDWLTAAVVSEDYTNGNSEFSLRIRVSPGPAATARLVIWQPGARLELTVTRGEVSSIDNLQLITDGSQFRIHNSEFIISPHSTPGNNQQTFFSLAGFRIPLSHILFRH